MILLSFKLIFHMISKKISLSVFSILFIFSALAIENSVIPDLEKFENIENLPIKKFSDNQYQEIVSALNHKEDRIRAVSYNMLFNLYDNNLDKQNRWKERLPRIVEVIDEMQPDIIGVQELYKDQFDDLMPYLSKVFAFYAKPCEDGELNGIFYRKERFEVVSSKVWYMTETPDSLSSETLTMLQLKDRKTGRSVTIFNTHLAFSKINRREFQARFIAEHIVPFAKQTPILLTGDLNTFANRLDLRNLPFYDGDYIHRILKNAPLHDAREVSILGHLGPISTFTNSSDDGIPFKGIGTPGIFLDHIYVSKGITVLVHAVQPAKVGGHFPSDHMPVLIDFYLE